MGKRDRYKDNGIYEEAYKQVDATMFQTEKERTKNDNEKLKRLVEYYDMTLPYNKEELENDEENRSIHRGEWPQLANYQAKPLSFTEKTKDRDGRTVTNTEEIDLTMPISHCPVQNIVTNNIMGSIIAHPLRPVVKDYSMTGRKYREEQQIEILRTNYYEKIYEPHAQKIRSQYYQEIGVTDPFQLSPEEQRQVESDLQQRLKSGIPREIMEDLQRVSTPDEIIRQVLLDNDIVEHKIRSKFISGGETALVNAKEAYKMVKFNGQPDIEVLDNRFLRVLKSRQEEWFQNGSAATYVRYLTPSELITRHGSAVLVDKTFFGDLKSQFTDLHNQDAYGQWGGHGNMERVDLDFVDAVGAGYNVGDWRSRSGQERIKGLYQELSMHHRYDNGIREVYSVFKVSETIKHLSRKDTDGVIRSYYLSSDYVMSKEKGDLKVTVYPINRVYHGYKVGTKTFTGLGPVEWQFNSVNDVFNPQLTIFGTEFGKQLGDTKKRSIIDNGKQYALKLNISATKLEELEKSDHGRIMAMDISSKPDGISVGEWYRSIYQGKSFIYSRYGTQANANSRAQDAVDSVDLSGSSSMQHYLSSIEIWEQKIYKSMGSNPYALGNASEYASNALAQNQAASSDQQLAVFHERRRELKEMVLNYFSDLSLECLFDDEEKKATLFDDFTKLHIETNYSHLKGAKVRTKIVDDYGELKRVEAIQAQILAFVQNGGSLEDIIGIMEASTVSEMKQIAKIAGMRAKEAAAAQNQATADQIKSQMAIQQQLLEIKSSLKMQEDAANNATKTRNAEIQATTLLQANDVNKNNQNDAYEKSQEETAFKLKVHNDEMELKREELKIKNKVASKPKAGG